MYDVIYRDIRSAGSKTKRTDGQYGNIGSVLRGLLEGKLSEIQILTSSCFSCVSVCLSVAFRLLNQVTWLQILCEHYDGLGEHQEVSGFVCRHLVVTEWSACELLWCERCRPYTVCYWVVEIRKKFINSM